MKIKSGSLFLIFILLLMVFAAWEAIRFGHYEAMLAPLLLSLAILVLGTIELARELRSKDKRQQITEDEDLPPMVVAQHEGGSDMGRFGMALGWIGGFAFGIYLFGFFLSTLFFAFLYLKVRGRGWLPTAGFAVGFTVLLYMIFQVGLRSQLYRGLVFGGWF
jgi:hypothetical protein